MLAFILGIGGFVALVIGLLVLSCFWSVFKFVLKAFGGIAIGVAVVCLLVKLVMVSIYVVVVVLGIVGVVALCRRKSG